MIWREKQCLPLVKPTKLLNPIPSPSLPCFWFRSLLPHNNSMVMASFPATSLRFCIPIKMNHNQVLRRSLAGRGLLNNNNGFHLRGVSCAAKPEIVDKVCSIVRKQLALPETSELTPESKFAALGADSLDTVEIIMTLEEEFSISIEEDSAQNITTVQEAADLIEDLVVKQQS